MPRLSVRAEPGTVFQKPWAWAVPWSLEAQRGPMLSQGPPQGSQKAQGQAAGSMLRPGRAHSPENQRSLQWSPVWPVLLCSTRPANTLRSARPPGSFLSATLSLASLCRESVFGAPEPTAHYGRWPPLRHRTGTARAFWSQFQPCLDPVEWSP